MTSPAVLEPSSNHTLSSHSISPDAPIEPASLATGVGLMERQDETCEADLREGKATSTSGGTPARPGQSLLIWERLRRDMPLPSEKTLWIMLMTLFLVMFLLGWNDASQGPLLPSLQEYYSVNYLVISCIWISSFIGFLTSGIANVPLTDRLGFGIACPTGAASQALGYVLMLWGSPFPLFVIAYLFLGFGLGLQDAQVNSLTSRLENAQTKMFLMHAVYGLGATIAPLIATEFVKSFPNRAYLYFSVSLALAALTGLALLVVFRLRTEDQVVGKRRPMPEVRRASGDESIETELEKRAREKREKDYGDGGSGSKMRRIMKTPAVHFMAFYILIYVGIEVTIGGWLTSFILDERGGNDNAGYTTTGYFGGITLGRVLLIPVTDYLGNGNAVYLYSLVAIALELIIWFTTSIPGNAVCFALVGFCLGPMYPIVMMTVIEVLPGELQAGSIGWIASLGQAGSAIMPFITGAIANRYGVWILQPLVIAFLGFSLILWALVKRPELKLGNARLKESMARQRAGPESASGVVDAQAGMGETGIDALEEDREKGRKSR